MTDQKAIRLTTPQLAQALGCSKRHIQQLAKDGIIPKSDRGRWPLEAIAAFVAYVQADARRGPADYALERARLTRAQADVAELGLAERRGDLLAREDVDAAVGAAFARVRSRLLAVPSKCAAEAAQSGDPLEAEGVIRAAVYDALTELSRTTPEDLMQQ